MIIHTHQPEEVIEILRNNNFSWKIKTKKVFENNYEKFNWFKLPDFNTDEKLIKTTFFNVETDDTDRLFKCFNQKPKKVGYIHYKKEESLYKNYKYEITHTVNPIYPVYVISRGRYLKRYTTDSLEKMNVPYKIVIEHHELSEYSKYIPKENIITFVRKESDPKGSTPARNICWMHSRLHGHSKHWVLDDNIDGFFRWNYNVKKRVESGVVFRVIEDYLSRFDNIAVAAMNYFFDLAAIHVEKSILTYNNKCYSCMLIDTKLMKSKGINGWEGTYNEDVDLVIRTLKSGLCSVSFNNFLCGKKATGSVKGGNQDIYDGFTESGFLKKFNEIYERYPDCVK